MTSPVGPESLGPSPPRPVLRRSMSAVLPVKIACHEECRISVMSAGVALSEKLPQDG